MDWQARRIPRGMKCSEAHKSAAGHPETEHLVKSPTIVSGGNLTFLRHKAALQDSTHFKSTQLCIHYTSKMQKPILRCVFFVRRDCLLFNRNNLGAPLQEHNTVTDTQMHEKVCIQVNYINVFERNVNTRIMRQTPMHCFLLSSEG